MTKKIRNIFLLGITLVTFSCETTDLQVLNDPNNIDPALADVDLFLNSIQLGLTDFFTGVEGSGFDGMSEFGMEATRMLHGFGPTYLELNDPASFNQIWTNAYAVTLADIRAMTPLAEASNRYTHLAIAQIVEAYIIMTLVDYFGDIPYTEAILGVENLNPVLDSGASVYEAADTLLLQAIANLALEEDFGVATDLYYAADENPDDNPAYKDSWRKLAKTLRLKLYLQTRLVNESESIATINALIADDDLITSSADDFQYQYSTNLAAPDSRHPWFDKNFDGAGPSADFIMANYYMNLLANRYDQIDPRVRYYFYRQEGDFSEANTQTQPCSTQPRPSFYAADELYCQVPNDNGYNGLWGWDHMNADGIPPHDAFVTVFGVYPVGGPFDNSSFRNVSGSEAASEGLQGAGISPIMLSSYTNFMLAESALILGTTGDARTYLEQGITESMNKVVAFGSSIATAPSQTEIDDHVADILADYDAATTDTDRLKVIAEQYFVALWGNGIEAYNTYRRTGQPADLQPAVDVANPGTFVRSNWYPTGATDTNSNINQKPGVSAPVFWDTNPEGFVD